MSGFRPLVSMSWGSDLLIDADRNKWYRRITQYVLNRSDILIGDCQPVREKAISFGVPDERIITFPWGVDVERFSPGEDTAGLRERAGWQDAFVLLHLRTWEPIYGVDVFIRGFIRAARHVPELRLFLLGNGSLAGPLRQMILNGQVMDRVHFTGQVPQDKLPDYYKAADLYISASHSDGSSVSLLEALASGLPALVSDIPGNREWAVPEVGWRFPDGDSETLAALIIQAAEDRKHLAQLSTAARQVAEERADWNKNSKQMLAAYEMAVAANK
jgi:glycosyltransferase involved in cell wall biosynthesis